jgi:hypothetical protein
VSPPTDDPAIEVEVVGIRAARAGDAGDTSIERQTDRQGDWTYRRKDHQIVRRSCLRHEPGDRDGTQDRGRREGSGQWPTCSFAFASSPPEKAWPLVPASIAQIARTGIAYGALQPTVYGDLAIARLKSTAADTALDRFVEAARKAAERT